MVFPVGNTGGEYKKLPAGRASPACPPKLKERRRKLCSMRGIAVQQR
ncbi:MAG: hypothetical protein R3D71_03785 [Rickettsiales bacterium]